MVGHEKLVGIIWLSMRHYRVPSYRQVDKYIQCILLHNNLFTYSYCESDMTCESQAVTPTPAQWIYFLKMTMLPSWWSWNWFWRSFELIKICIDFVYSIVHNISGRAINLEFNSVRLFITRTRNWFKSQNFLDDKYCHFIGGDSSFRQK